MAVHHITVGQKLWAMRVTRLAAGSLHDLPAARHWLGTPNGGVVRHLRRPFTSLPRQIEARRARERAVRSSFKRRQTAVCAAASSVAVPAAGPGVDGMPGAASGVRPASLVLFKSSSWNLSTAMQADT